MLLKLMAASVITNLIGDLCNLQQFKNDIYRMMKNDQKMNKTGGGRVMGLDGKS